MIAMISAMCSVARGMWSMPSTLERLEAVEVVGGHPLGQLLDGRAVLLGLDDQLVVDVGDVDDPGHLVAAGRRGSA